MDLGQDAAAPPRIAACILSCDYGRYLGQAIGSCLGQEPGAYILTEIVVIDDGSADDSLQVCSGFGERIRVIEGPRRGFATTLSACIQQCRSDWIALLDADDWFAPSKLRTVAPHLLPSIHFLQHWENVVDPDGRPLLETPHPGGNTSTLLVRRAAAEALLPVTNELFFHVLADLGHGTCLTDPLTYYRVHDASMTDRTRPGAWQQYLSAVCRDVAARLRDLQQTPPDWGDLAGLRRLRWHYQAEASSRLVEAALQRGSRVLAIPPLIRTLLFTTWAGRPLSSRTREIRAIATGRPAVRLFMTRPGDT